MLRFQENGKKIPRLDEIEECSIVTTMNRFGN